jgi:hypothetical protein
MDVVKRKFINQEVDIKFKLSALWIVHMFVFIYTDYYSLFMPGVLADAMTGVIWGVQVTDLLLLVFALVTILPGVMIFLCLALPARINRLSNLVVGTLYTVVGVASLLDHAWPFWVMYCLLLTAIPMTVVAYSFKWPREARGGPRLSDFQAGL